MTTLPPLLLFATLAVPLAFLAASLIPSWRMRVLALQWLAPLPGLLAGLFSLRSGPTSVDIAPLGFTLALDAPGALLLSAAALLWIVLGAAIWRDGAPDARFGYSWLLTMTGSLGVFVAGDLVSFYLLYALVSLPAYGLFAFAAHESTRRAGSIYMAFAILGEAVLLLAFATLAAGSPDSCVRIADCVRALASTPMRDATIALLIAGFGMKLGMVPFNGWMPLNYAASPIPVAAVLSGAGAKAGVIGLIRFLPFESGLPLPGQTLALLGFLSALVGVAIGLTQRNTKAILAYSSISQLGVVAAALGMAMASGAQSATMEVAFYGVNHLLVKSALFLVVGAVAARGMKLSGWSLALVGALALSLAGLPLTGGALAKLATKPQFEGSWTSSAATLSSIGSAWLMTHFVLRLDTPPHDAGEQTPRFIVRFWPAFALGAILLPWLVSAATGDASKALQPTEILSGLWPVALGAALALGLRGVGDRLPHVPAGDGVVLFEAGFRRLMAAGPKFEALDASLRQWPLAGVAFLAIVLAMLGASLSGR